MITRQLKVDPLTAKAFAPYGDVLGVSSDQPLHERENWRYWQPSTFVHEQSVVRLAVWEITRQPFVIDEMERHLRETQVYVPLGGSACVFVVAPPTNETMPDLDRVRAFMSDGRAGVRFHKGTWHHYPLAVGAAAAFVVIHSRAAATPEDMDIRENFERLTGVHFELVL